MMNLTPIQINDSDIVQLFNYLTKICLSVQKVKEILPAWNSVLMVPLTEIIYELSLAISLESPSEKERHFILLWNSLEKLIDEAQHLPQEHPYSVRLAKISAEIKDKAILIKSLIQQRAE